MSRIIFIFYPNLKKATLIASEPLSRFSQVSYKFSQYCVLICGCFAFAHKNSARDACERFSLFLYAFRIYYIYYSPCKLNYIFITKSEHSIVEIIC